MSKHSRATVPTPGRRRRTAAGLAGASALTATLISLALNPAVPPAPDRVAPAAAITPVSAQVAAGQPAVVRPAAGHARFAAAPGSGHLAATGSPSADVPLAMGGAAVVATGASFLFSAIRRGSVRRRRS